MILSRGVWSYSDIQSQLNWIELGLAYWAELGNKFGDSRISAVQKRGSDRHEWFIKKGEDDCSDNNHCFFFTYFQDRLCNVIIKHCFTITNDFVKKLIFNPTYINIFVLSVELVSVSGINTRWVAC